ncbi:Adhesion G protein-coupled receptor E2 [Acropora cervicornis]|uniref:Adhesion G protein-coupled receptor E2 n=1 Tax=Acropora cervicornis TaxID=6130 RepID=A0AAD9V1H6_ACRCE|nr:Adhesion G protein-coupled receptor E2 [Acropora cervicornis]
MPGGVCDTNFECVDTENSYSCACRGGFKYEIMKNTKRCVEGYERVFNVNESSNVCQESEYCQNGTCSQELRVCKNIMGTEISMSVYWMLVGVTPYATTLKDLSAANVKRASRAQVVMEKIVLISMSVYWMLVGVTPYATTLKDLSAANVKRASRAQVVMGKIVLCERKTDECHKKANCTNLIGSYSCACPSGLRGDGKHLCTDINECLLDACGSNSICTNTKGSFRCKCKPGFQSTSGDGKDCSDVNECAKDNLLCGSAAKCKNKPATYECVCKKGFSLHKANKKCLDTDECKEDPDICGPHTICRNVPGSYECSCKEGFTSGEGELQCKDVDECANNKYKCEKNSSCENTPGSFICKCKSGFRKNHKGQCEGKQSILDQQAALTSVLNAFIVLSVSAFHVIGTKGKI